MDYKYLGYTEDKKVVKGTISASNAEIAMQLLAHSGNRVVSLKPVTTFIPDWEEIFPSLYKVKPNVIITFSRQLALLLESGTDIVTSIELLQSQTSNKTFKKVLGETVSDLRSGSRLSASLGKHPEIFPFVYRQLLGVGERTGVLEVVLKQIADYIEREVATAKAVKSSLRYPIIVAVVAVLVIGVLVTFVLPAFMDLYTSLGAELPPLTKMLMSLIEGLRKYSLYLLIATALIIITGLRYIKTPIGMYKWHILLLKLPLIGRVIHLNELARLCRSMSLLFRAGVPLPDIMQLVIQSSKNKVLAAALNNVQQDMLKGEGLSQPMAKNGIFMPMMVQMVKVGEETGNLDATLLSVAQSYETEAADKTQALVAFIQPAMTVAIAIVVAFIAVSLLSAMYSVYGQMG